MFNAIAATYDFVNKTGSLGLDGYWRRRLVRRLSMTGARQVLDVACGSGVLSWMIYRRLHIQVTGIDVAASMLHIAEKKRESYRQKEELPIFVEGRAEQLPFDDGSFDAVTIAFGVRNFEDRQAALQEAFRVLRPQGHLFILDFATPRYPVWKFLFRIYFLHILPLWGWIISGNRDAYRYLPRSVDSFPQYEALCTELSDAGFSCLHWIPYTGGVATLYTGVRTYI